MYSENMAMMKEIKDNTEGKIYQCSWIVRINIFNVTTLPNTICGYNAIPKKLSMSFFTELEQNNF